MKNIAFIFLALCLSGCATFERDASAKELERLPMEPIFLVNAEIPEHLKAYKNLWVVLGFNLTSDPASKLWLSPSNIKLISTSHPDSSILYANAVKALEAWSFGNYRFPADVSKRRYFIKLKSNSNGNSLIPDFSATLE